MAAVAPAPARPGWHARLALHAHRDGERTVVHAEHEGPLRVLKALYPESPAVCHHVLVHPPAGIVGGDELTIDLRLDETSHLVLTTPGATRFYRSAGADAAQRVAASLAPASRLEWLPLETLVYSGAQALNHQRFVLAAGAEMIGWDLLALGLPAADLPFAQGFVEQHLEVPGLWLERGRIAGTDRRLLDAPPGLAGHRVLGTMWWCAGAGAQRLRAEAVLEAARGIEAGAGLVGAATALDARLVVVRALAHRTEPLLHWFRALRLAWRQTVWRMPALEPRVWST